MGLYSVLYVCNLAILRVKRGKWGKSMLQIAICDDNREDSRKICALLKQVLDGYSIRYGIQEFEDGEELVDSAVIFDLIFIDVRLNGKDGIEVAEKLYSRNKASKIIFQSRLNQYCGDAVNKSHAFAFLEKPVEREILEKQIKDFLAIWRNAQETWISLIQIGASSPENRRQMVRLPVCDIIHFECQKNGKTIKAVTERGDFLYQGVFSDIEDRMAPFGFAVCNRGILVNLNKIARLDGHDVIMTNGIKLPLSQRRNAAFKDRLQQFYYNPLVRGTEL